jgi:hypothetical protein
MPGKKRIIMRFITISLLLLFFLLSFSLKGQPTSQKEIIYPITRVVYEADYYTQQAALWEKETLSTPQNPEAWYNFYKAARNMRIKGAKPLYDLDRIVTDMGKHIPESFEYHFCRFWQSTYTRHDWDALFKAYEIAPDRPDGLHDFLTYYEKTGNREKLAEYAHKWFESGNFSPGMVNWNYNLLAGVDEDAILITYGDNDTYPLWMLQQVHNLRKDVQVLNIHLLTGWDDYRKRISKDLNIPFLPWDEMDAENPYASCLSHFLKHARRPLYVAVTLRPSMREAHQDDLYLTGLAFRHSKEGFDDMAELKNNWEHKFRIDYLFLSLQADISAPLVAYVNMNYLPGLLKLIKHYRESGDLYKAREMEELVRVIGKKAEREEEVNTYLNNL